jgi:hydrogenase maturation protease
VDLYDLGTASLRLLHIVDHCAKMVIVDCALMGMTPGTLRRFTFQEAKSAKTLPRHSLHEGDVFEVLALSSAQGQNLPEIVFFGVEPETMELKDSLSAELERRLPGYLSAVAVECGLSAGGATDA